jgi:hypothetical protein
MEEPNDGNSDNNNSGAINPKVKVKVAPKAKASPKAKKAQKAQSMAFQEKQSSEDILGDMLAMLVSPSPSQEDEEEDIEEAETKVKSEVKEKQAKKEEKVKDGINESYDDFVKYLRDDEKEHGGESLSISASLSLVELLQERLVAERKASSKLRLELDQRLNAMKYPRRGR